MEAPVLDIEEQTGQGDPLGILSKKKAAAPVQKADPLNILPQPKQTVPAQTPAPTQQTFPAYDSRNLIAPIARESTQGPVVNVPAAANKTSADIHTEKLQQARNNLVTNFNEHSDQAIRKIVSKNIEDEFKKLGSAFQDGQIDEKTFKAQQNALFQRMINTSQEVNQYKQDMSQDPTKVRQVVHTIADTHPDKAPQLQSDMYLLDAQNRPQKANKIVFNANKMQKGEMNYDIKNGIVKRPEGFFESLGSGLKERNRMMKDYDFYQGKSDKDVIGKLELERAKFDPDEPVAAPSGISGHIGGAIGSQGIVTAKGAGAAALTSMIPVAGEAAAPWMAAAVTSPEFYKTGWVSSLERNYHEFRNKGLAPQEALNKAKDRADFDAKVDVAQGIVSTALGTKMGLKAVGSVGGELSPTFQNTIKNIALKSGKWLGKTSLEGGANAMIAGGMQELKNIHSGRPTGEGAIQAGMGQLMFSYGLGALTKAGKALLTPSAHRTILNEMSRAPEEQVNNTLGQLVNDGTITQEDATDVHNQIQNHKELAGKIPEEITDSKTRDKVQELIDKRTSLEQKLETVDKAFHPGIKEQIDKVNEQITAASKKGTKADKEEEPETFKSPIDRAKELINQDVVKGFSAEPLKEAAKEESGQKLEGMLRDIAQQAHDPATEGATIETYGPELVKISKEIHPEHFINEHKVTMPEPEKSVTEGAEINPSGVSGAAPSVQTTDVFRTLDYGENKGKEENAAAQDKIKEQILSNEPIGNTGEKFGDFVNRVIPAFKETLKNEPHNTTIVTHSSVIKALRVWEEMGRPEVNDKNIKEFAEKYINLKPEKEGEVHTLKGEDGKEIKVVRHGETEDNKLSEFRQDDTKLTDKGISQAGKAGDNLLKETGGNIPKIISSDLPRTQHTSEIINNKLKENALPIESAGSVLQHPQEGIGSEGSGRERVEPSQQGEEPTGEGKPVGNTEEENKGSGEKETIGTKRSINDVLRDRMGLQPVPIPKLGTDTEEMSLAKERVDKGKSNPFDIVQKILTTKDIKDIGLSTNERYDMQYHMLQLRQRGMELNNAINEVTDRLSKSPDDKSLQEQFILLTQQRAQHADDYIRAANANRIGSAVWGQSGNAMQVELDENGQVLQRIQRIQDWYGGNVPEGVKKKLEEVQTKLDDANTKLQKLQADYDAKVLENEQLKAQKAAGKKLRKTSEDFKAERKDIVADIKDVLKKSRGKLKATIVPVDDLIAITPHLAKLFKSYAEEGFYKAEEVVSKIFHDVKDHVPGITQQDVKDVLVGKYKEGKKPTPKDEEYVKAQQAKANAMLMLRKLEKEAKDSQKNLYMKGLDFATQWERRIIFAFNNAVFMKLGSAALLGSAAHKPIEFAIGKGIAKIAPKLAKSAPIEGNENLQSLGTFYGEFFDPIKFAKEAWQIYSYGESTLTKELSGKGHVGYTFDKKSEYLKPILDVYTNTHQVIKDPVKRAVFESSMLNALQWYRDNGLDATHPLIMEEARQYAYKRAEYEIFQNKSAVASWFNKNIAALENKAIEEVNSHKWYGQVSGSLKYSVSTLYHMLVPVATVPINITSRAAVGLKLPATIWKAAQMEKGIREMSPEQADVVLRQLKKGAIGAAYWTLGLFLAGNAGGLWNKYDPDKKRGKDIKPDRAASNELNVFGVDIPKEVQHTPQLQALQYGATLGNVYNHYVKDLGEEDANALGAGMMAQIEAMVEGIPPLKEGTQVASGLLGDQYQLNKTAEDLKRGFGINRLEDAGILPKETTKPKRGGSGGGGGAGGNYGGYSRYQ